MARRKGANLILAGIVGQIGKQVVIKQYDYGTVVTKYPDMSNVKRTEKQKEAQARFRKAVAYAQELMRDEVRRKALEKKLKKGQTVFRRAVREGMECFGKLSTGG